MTTFIGGLGTDRPFSVRVVTNKLSDAHVPTPRSSSLLCRSERLCSDLMLLFIPAPPCGCAQKLSASPAQ